MGFIRGPRHDSVDIVDDRWTGGGYVGATRTFGIGGSILLMYSIPWLLCSAVWLMYMDILKSASLLQGSSRSHRVACAAIMTPIVQPWQLWRVAADKYHTFHHTSFRMEACHFSVRCINGSPSTPCRLLNRRPKTRRPESGDAGTTCIFAALGRIWIGWQDIRCASWAILPSVE
jgi:hypothetical protein